MRSIIQRYLGSSFIPPFVVSLSFFVSFLLTFKLLKITKLVINKGVDFILILELLGHIAITFIPISMPLSILFASIYSLNRLSSDSEFLAMRSFGYSKEKLLLPFIIVGTILSILIYSLNSSLIPYSKRRTRNIVANLTTKGILTDIKAGLFFTDIPSVTIYANKVENKGKNLKDVFIYLENKDKVSSKIIMAKEGFLIGKNDANDVVNNSFMMKLLDGNIVKINKKKKDIEKILFSKYRFPLSEHEIRGGFLMKNNMRTTRELFDIITNSNNKIRTKMSLENLIETQLEFWSRINTSFLCLVFIFLGFSLGVQKSRGRNQNSALICFIVLVFYYAIFFTSFSISRENTIPTYLAVFFPTTLTFIAGIFLFRRMEWVA